jgi:myo-inositol-1(or 4)-monophosphatase
MDGQRRRFLTRSAGLGSKVALKANEAVRRHLTGEPRANSDERLPWDVRKTGSAAIECALVAAGLLRVARFAQLNIWNIAGGAAPVRAIGSEARTRTGQGWVTLERFEAKGTRSGGTDLRPWRQPVILGEPGAVEMLCRRHG